MRSINRAGWASHGFFGFNAQTFGNPDGATSGGGAWTGVTNQGGDGAAAGLGRAGIRDGGLNVNGPGQGGGGHAPPVLPAFVQVDGGTFAGQNIIDVAILSASDIVVLLESSEVGFSSDGGHTWNISAGPGAPVTSAQSLCSNSNGTIILMSCEASGAPKIATSTNQGASWAVTDPGLGSFISPQVFYSPIVNLFFFFDTEADAIWTASDGATWTQHPTPNNFPAVPVSVANGSGFCKADGNSTLVVQSNTATDFEIWVSGDGTDWAVAYTAPVVGQPLTMRWTGTKFISATLDADNVTVSFLESNSDGTAWAVTSTNGGDDTVGPYNINEVPYKGILFSGFDGTDSTSIASSPDGVSWTDVPLTAPNETGVGMTVTPDFMFLWGAALMGTNDGVTYSTLLSGLPGFGTIHSLNTGAGLAFAVGFGAFGGLIYRAVV